VSSLPKKLMKDMVHSSSEMCAFPFQYCRDKHRPSWLVYIDQEQALSTVPLFGFRTLQIGCLASSIREFPHHAVLPRAPCMPATLLVWISLVCSSYPPGFPIEKILKLNSTTSRLEIPEILSCALCYSLSLAISLFTLGHFLLSCFIVPFSFSLSGILLCRIVNTVKINREV
jgi:hypothetical protein